METRRENKLSEDIINTKHWEGHETRSKNGRNWLEQF